MHLQGKVLSLFLSTSHWKDYINLITEIQFIFYLYLVLLWSVILKHCRLAWGSRKQRPDKTELINWSTTEPSHYMPYCTINNHIWHKHHTTSHYKPKRQWLRLKRLFWPKPWHYYHLPKFLEEFQNVLIQQFELL